MPHTNARRPRRNRRKKQGGAIRALLLGLCAVMLMGLLALGFRALQRSRVARYPVLYTREIQFYALENQVPAPLLAAMIMAESSYDPNAVSGVGARGLMQVMPETGAWIAGKLDEPFSEQALFEPDVSIRYGAWYMSFLLRRYEGDFTCAVAAYHAGQGNVDAWLKNPQYSSDGVTLDVIPTEDTATYAGRVLRARDVYRKYYFPVPDEAQEGDSPDA